jgi:hypothetical protein
MNVLNRIELFRLRREARTARWKASPDHRRLLDRLCADGWQSADGDVEKAVLTTRRTLETLVSEGRVSIDPATILFLVQIAITIYKLLKASGLLSTTPEAIVAMLDDEDDTNG